MITTSGGTCKLRYGMDKVNLNELAVEGRKIGTIICEE